MTRTRASNLNNDMLSSNRWSSSWFLFLCCLALVASSIAQSAPRMPRIEGESLAGHKINLPEAAAGKVAVLVFGFTKASKEPTGAWAERLQAEFGSRSDFELYQLPVLEDIPRLFRGMVISGIRKGVAENKRDHFVPILQGEVALKKLVQYREPDDAYLVVLDRAGNILEQSHGSLDDSAYARLRAHIDSALSQK